MKLLLGITGASGSIYAKRMIEHLLGAKPGLELHIVASTMAAAVWRNELGEDMPKAFGPGTQLWDPNDFSAPFASGSNPVDATIVLPCSMSTLARVAHGGGEGLLLRACEVALKERKPIVLVARETPLSLVQLRNMVAVTEAGAIVLPAVPSFYGHTRSLEEALDSVLQRVLDRVGLQLPLLPRWGQ